MEMLTTGSIVNWLRHRVLGAGGSAPSYEELNEAACALPPGSEDLLALDHFQVRGERGGGDKVGL